MTIVIIVAVVVLLALVALVVIMRSGARRAPGGPSAPSTVAEPTPDTPPTEAPPAPEARGPPSEPVAPVEEAAPPAEPLEAPSYRERLGRTRGLFASLRALTGRGAIDQSALDELEETLLGADIGVATSDHLLELIGERAREEGGGHVDDLVGLLRAELISMLETTADGGRVDRSLSTEAPEGRVPVWLFVGVNGVGKTTTIGKLATREASEGRTVLLAAGDTFRAAAADQLAMWGERAGAEVVRGAEGADPSAVVFDAIERAGARDVDLVLADTAGRLHNKVNLVEELKKIRRVADRPPGAVVEVLLVLDATTGQNAISQATQFLEAVDATGVVLTKLDGTARGGVVVAIQRELGLPVKLVGLGESAGDLVAFDAEAFVDALLDS